MSFTPLPIVRTPKSNHTNKGGLGGHGPYAVSVPPKTDSPAQAPTKATAVPQRVYKVGHAILIFYIFTDLYLLGYLLFEKYYLFFFGLFAIIEFPPFPSLNWLQLMIPTRKSRAPTRRLSPRTRRNQRSNRRRHASAQLTTGPQTAMATSRPHRNASQAVRPKTFRSDS